MKKGLWWPYLCMAVSGFKRLSSKVESSFLSFRLSKKSSSLLIFLAETQLQS